MCENSAIFQSYVNLTPKRIQRAVLLKIQLEISNVLYFEFGDHCETKNFTANIFLFSQYQISQLSRITRKGGVIRDTLLMQNLCYSFKIVSMKKLIYNLQSIVDLYLWVSVRGDGYKGISNLKNVKKCPELPRLTVVNLQIVVQGCILLFIHDDR